MANNSKFRLNTWLGIGAKYGGFLGFFGAESTQGKIFSIYDASYRHSFSLTNARLGLGLGGGGGLVALCVFNCPNIWQIHNTSNNDWGVNVSLGGKWSAVVKTLSNYKFFTTVAKIGTKLRIHDPKDLDSIRNSLHYLYNEYDVATATPGVPKVVSIDLPAGMGVELSASYSFGGKIQVF